jgi:hypothetical protein
MSVNYSTLYGADADEKLSPTYEVNAENIVIHSTIYGGRGNELNSRNMTARDLTERYLNFG